jgi:MarR family transcriptional regulator, organic hydroperoxide resistance regulator
MHDKRLFYKFNRAQHLLYEHVEKGLLSEVGITPIQLGALFFLLKHDGCLHKDLAKGLHLNKPAVTGLVARMEKARLIRKGSSRDGRAIHLFLTSRAIDLSQKAFPLLDRLNRTITEGFTSAEIDVVHRFLDNIMNLLVEERSHD